MKYNYDLVLYEAEIKKKQQLNIIKCRCCPNCLNKKNGCLNLEHTLKNSVEVYKCLNYLKF